MTQDSKVERAEVLPPITLPLTDSDAAVAVEFLRNLNAAWVDGIVGKRTGEQLPANWSEMIRFALKGMAYVTGAKIDPPEFMPDVEMPITSQPDMLVTVLKTARKQYLAAIGKPEEVTPLTDEPVVEAVTDVAE